MKHQRVFVVSQGEDAAQPNPREGNAAQAERFFDEQQRRFHLLRRPHEITGGGGIQFVFAAACMTSGGDWLTGSLHIWSDGDNVIQELGGSGNPLASYAHGPGVDEPLALYSGPTTSYCHADGLGSLTALTDPTGAVAASYVYDSFGNLTASTGTITNAYRYTAREFDSETGLYYYRARYYDPATGRFATEDPDKSSSPQSLYPYADNSPVRLTDALGMQVQSPVLVWPWTPQQTSQLTAGWVEALNRLKDSGCRKLFCNKHQRLDPTDLLRKTQYEAQTLSNGAAAATMASTLVYINAAGQFFETGTTAYIPYDKPGLSGMRPVQFDSVADLDAFILLHELGHQVGIFPPDLFGFINGGHSLRVLDACFKKGAKVGE